MFFLPGSGVKLSTAIISGAAAATMAAGLAVGIGVEANKRAINNDKLTTLQKEIDRANDIKREVNITPPRGNGFINR